VIEAILDTGPLVGALDRDDQWHAWAAEQFAAIQTPALTCEAVISEACFLLRTVPGARDKIFALVERGLVRVVPVLPGESPAVRALLARYGERMDYADACLVRLAELHRDRPVVTTDANDFRIYRRFGKQTLELIVP
jgi:predicted nucleic acid-binding protein